MSDVERLVLETLRRHETEVPLPDPSEARPVARRTRRRQVLNALGASLVAVVIAVGATAGIGALLRASEQKPATNLEPPADAPIIVGSGTSDGWPWLLSASADGTCVAFTDAQGSETTCGIGVTLDRFISASVRSPRPPAPPLVFLFGRTPPTTDSVEVRLPTLEETQGDVFPAPGGVNLNVRYFVSWISGYAYPYVPEMTAQAEDAEGTPVDGPPEPIARPDWALPPEFTMLERVASGPREVLVPGSTDPELTLETWEIGVFRNEATGLLCVGEPGGPSACGQEDDPVPAWTSAWRPIELVTLHHAMNGAGTHTWKFGWGVYREPVVSLRWTGDAEVEQYELPAEYGRPFTIFVYSCGDCTIGTVRGFDADGNVVDPSVPTPPSTSGSFTVVDGIASGTLEQNDFFDASPWEISILRNESTGELCIGHRWLVERWTETNICGPEDDPVPAWLSRSSRMEVIGDGAQMAFGVSSVLVWGVISDPVVSVRVERLSGPPVEAELYEFPAKYGHPFTAFVYACSGRDCLEEVLLGLDADGNVIERERLG